MENNFVLLDKIIKHNHSRNELNLKIAAIKGIKNFIKVFVDFVDKNPQLEFWEYATDRPTDPHSNKSIAEIYSLISGYSYKEEPIITKVYNYIDTLISTIILMESIYVGGRKNEFNEEENNKDDILRLLEYGKFFNKGKTIAELTIEVQNLRNEILVVKNKLEVPNTRSIVITTEDDKILVDCEISGTLKTVKGQALIDTGAQESLLDLETAKEIKAIKTGRIRYVKGISGDIQKLQEAKIHVKLIQGDRSAEGEFLASVFKDTKDVTGGNLLLLGMDFSRERGKRIKIEIE
jgi:hypothetical protein